METKKEEDEGRTEVTRDLPNGVMTISLTSARVSGNAGPPLVQKLGFHQGPFLRRSIRSKNVEPLPVGPLKKFPCGKGLGRGRKRICHRCGESKAVRMVRCSSCLKESFCSSCVKKWYSEMSEVEVKVSCPICRGYCDCKTCMLAGAKAGGCKLLPVLKQISQEQKTELEIEANNQEDYQVFRFKWQNVALMSYLTAITARTQSLIFLEAAPSVLINFA
uniref:Uncharacterized protein LOC105032111 isoform X4 n=1 Tax=Elaeis guineensis var. tenera TaxID=51953 RepID=A0A8N4EPR0_ELAGV|nr:uncharacterized protein LOC105032111 isoform X4 [Elaeis guineensis]